MISSYYIWKWADNDLPGKPSRVFSSLLRGEKHPALQIFNARKLLRRLEAFAANRRRLGEEWHWELHPADTLGDMVKALNRSPVYLTGLQKRFELPVFEGAYPHAYLAFLRVVINLRTFDISEEALRDLWQLEKKLLQLLHVDSTGSPTWFLDSCGAFTCRDRRLLLTNHDLGIPLTGSEVQTGLNFASSLPELFAGKEMGEDALRVLRECLKHRARILADIATELPHIRTAVKWATPLARQT